jgi:hypothetical protein
VNCGDRILQAILLGVALVAIGVGLLTAFWRL